MSKPTNKDELVRHFRDAIAGGLGAQPPHIADDEETLSCWSEGLLSDNDRRLIIEHLSRCSSCRERIASMTRDGVLNWEIEGESSIDSPINGRIRLPETPSLLVSGTRRWLGPVIAVAACLLVGLFLWGPLGESPTQLALAKVELDRGEVQAAFDRLSKYIERNREKSVDDGASTLLEMAGYKVAQGKLLAGDFAGAGSVVTQTEARGAGSGRLANLHLQAERKIAAESSLDTYGTLLAYGVDLDGATRSKSLPTFDESNDRILAAAKNAAAKYPDELQLKLNRGQMLLLVGSAEAARIEFEAALAVKPANPEAMMGLGLSLYQLGDVAKAMQSFEQVLGGEAANADARVNKAICLERLGQGEEANLIWRNVLSDLDDDALRTRIRTHVDRRE